MTKIKYEEAAEYLKNIEGWVCKKCGRFFGTESKIQAQSTWPNGAAQMICRVVLVNAK